jgi:predicted XRE-type DNA-binding protein
MKKAKSKTKHSESVFEELGFSPEESRILALKAQLATIIVRIAKKRNLTQKQLCKLWDAPQPRVSEVMSGKLNLVSIERLVELLAALNVEVTFKAKVSSQNTRKAS